MSNDIQFGIRITGDSAVATNAIKSTREEMDRLSTSGGKMASQYSGITSASEKATAAAKLQTSEYDKLDAQLTSLLSRLDPVYNATRQLDMASETLHQGLSQGLITQSQYQSALGQLEHQFGAAAEGADKSAFATAGARRELIVLGHEAVQGNFSRIPGSFMVLAERLGGLGGLISPLTIGITAIGAAVIGGVYAWEKWSDSAHTAAQKALDDFRQFEDEFDKDNKALEDYQKKLSAMSSAQVKVNIDVKQSEIDRIDKVIKSLHNDDGGLKGNINPFNPMGNEKEVQDLIKQRLELQKQINTATAALVDIEDKGGKSFREFIGDTSYMDVAHRKLADIAKVGADYAKALNDANSGEQRIQALKTYNQGVSNVNDRYMAKDHSQVFADSRVAAEKAEDDMIAKQQAEADKYALSQMDQRYANSSIKDADYYQQKMALVQKSSDAEVSAISKEMQAQAGSYNSATGIKKEQELTKLIGLEGKYSSALLSRAGVESRVNFEAEQAAEKAAQSATDQNNAMMQLIQQYDDEAQKQADDVASTYTKILQETEDLNASMISSDRQRAAEQLRIQHDRREQEIAMSKREQDDKNLLMEAENVRYSAAINESNSKLLKSKDLGKELGMTFSSAFENAVVGGQKFSQILQSLGQDIERIIMRKTVTEPLTAGLTGAIDKITSGAGDWFSNLFSANANGGVYSGAGIGAYSGQVVSHPTVFPFANGIGLMGEAGPEAIMPLKRGQDGKLGVSTNGGIGNSGINIEINVINNAQAQASVRQAPNGSGGATIDLFIEPIKKEFMRDISRGGDFAQTLQNQYGLNRAAGSLG